MLNLLMSENEILSSARRTIEMESASLIRSSGLIGSGFSGAVQLLLNMEGRAVLTGVGKSAIIAQKICATLNSTGTPAVFMHAADAIHGDLGTIQRADVVICLSKSGNTAEIKALIPLLKRDHNPLIALCGNPDSPLARQADWFIDCSVEKEACPHNLAPTTSTTVQLAIGDALAVCLLEARGFSSADFARYHPGGALGKRLYLSAAEAASANEKPAVQPDAPVHEVIVEISSKRLGATAVLNEGELAGVITDGDIRRMLSKHENLAGIKAKDIMNPSPKSIEDSELAIEALALMKKHNITQLILTRNNVYSGILHMHDLLREGII
jgi:arabinose-5-phosphate isomerase